MKRKVENQKRNNLDDTMNINAKEAMKIAGGGTGTSALSRCREIPCQTFY